MQWPTMDGGGANKKNIARIIEDTVHMFFYTEWLFYYKQQIKKVGIRSFGIEWVVYNVYIR